MQAELQGMPLDRREWPSSQQSPKKQPKPQMFDRNILGPALIESLRKLDPRQTIRNPVMFIVEIGAVIVTAYLVANIAGRDDEETWFLAAIAFWLWITVIFANLAEAVAEGRGKAQAATLRKTRAETTAKVLVDGRRDSSVVPLVGRAGSRGISCWWRQATSSLAMAR